MGEPAVTVIGDDSRSIVDLTREVTSTLDLQEVLDRSLAGLKRLIAFGGGSIQLAEDEGLALVAADPPAPPEAYRLRVPVGRGVGGRIVAEGRSIYIPDVLADGRVPPATQRALSAGVRSYFGVPLILAGRPIGVVQIDSPRVDGFSPAARNLLLSLAPAIAAAVQNARLYEREQAMVDELRVAQRLKNDFLSMVSHELRTPLTTVLGFSEMLSARGGDLPPELVAEFGRRIWRAGRWLSRMIGDLLDVSQIERGALALDVVPTDVPALIADVAAVSVEDPHPIAIAVEPGLPRAHADPERLRQVLGNVLSNARKFSPAGSAIEIAAGRSGERVEIRVRDRGRGIPPDQLERIFEPFVQVDPSDTRATGGLGTGLYLVRQLCRRMGADVRAESAEGSGSRFIVSLPIAGPPTAPAGAHDS